MEQDVQLSFGPFRLDRGNATLTRDDAKLDLTPKSLEVLHHLASHPGRLVTKEDLFDAVWPDVVVSDASIKACVREIRAALDDDPKIPTYIETVHRRGYRFIAKVTQSDAPSPLPSSLTSDLRPLTSPPTQHSALSTQHSPALVGRDPELQTLRAHFSRAASGDRQLVFLTGSPGSGKTSLLESFLSSLSTSPIPPLVLRGHCFEHFGAGEPYLPVREALSRAKSHPAVAAVLARHAAATDQAPAAALSLAREPRAASPQVLHELAEGLESLAADAPVVLAIEDAHWADYSTVDLLSALTRCRRAPRARLLILVTHRSSGATPSPIRTVAADLVAANLAAHLPLADLDELAVAKYLAARLPGCPFPPALVRHLHRRTDGHPLFLVHLVDDLIEQGVFIKHNDRRWSLAEDHTAATDPNATPAWLAVLDTQVPTTARAVIEGQLDRLTPAEVAALEAAAVAGVEFSAAAAAAAASADTVETESLCESLARRHRFLEYRGVTEWPDGAAATCYRFAHDLYHRVVYARIPAARRAAMHAAVCHRLESAYADRPEAIDAAPELAMHAEEGRLFPRAVTYLRAAAEATARQYAHREAVDYLRRALAALDRLPPADRADHELPLLTAYAVHLQVTRGCAAPEVEPILHRAYKLCIPTPRGPRTDPAPRPPLVSHDPSRAAEPQPTPRAVSTIYPVLWANWVYHKVRSDLERAETLAHDLLELADHADDPALLLQAHQAMAVTALCLGRPAVTRAQMDAAEQIYDPRTHAANTFLYGQDPGIAVYSFAAVATTILGLPEDGRAIADRTVALARRQSQPSSLAMALHFAAMRHQLDDDPRAVLATTAESLALSAKEGFSFWSAGGTILHAWARAALGDAPAALPQLRAGLDAWTATGSRTYVAYYLGLLAHALLSPSAPAGAFDEAGQVLSRALATATDLSEGLYEPELLRLKATWLRRHPAPTESPHDYLRRAQSLAASQQAHLFHRRATTDLAALPTTPTLAH